MKKLALLPATLLLLGACATAAPRPAAVVTLSPTTGQTAQGMVHFTENADGSVEVKVDLKNVPPGTHGFHIHDKGACDDNGNAAGGHYNPTNTPHGAPDASTHHAGDFGNVTADAAGEVHTTFTTRAITISPSATSALGHAVILHGGADDLTSQPSGNAGPRIACGVVEPAPSR